MSKMLNCLTNKDFSCVPIWFMRQAGRYLPEFRKIRSTNPDFLKLCFNSNLATEITLQPLKRFDLDAAIIFSDILVVPFALGQQIKFGERKGPFNINFNLENLMQTKAKDFISTLKPVYETIKKTKSITKDKQSLIAFVGAPWTLLIYLYNLKEQKNLKNKIAIKNKNEIKTVLKTLDKFLKLHIIQQKNAGAEIIQIFDSWAGLIQEDDLDEYCFKPNQSLVKFCKENNIPSICFPKGLKDNYKKFLEQVRPDAINIDHEINPQWAATNLKGICVQGGMNPELLLKSENEVLKETEKYLEIFKNIPYIFNLGHGILPQTNPEIIKKIVDKVKLVKR